MCIRDRDNATIPKLNLMEEVLLMGLKDKEGYLSFWNDNISYALRGCILIELALRGKIQVVNDSARKRFDVSERLVEVINATKTGEVLLDEALNLMKNDEPLTIANWIDLLSGETWNFMNLSSCYYYTDKDIIKNYETQALLDRENIGIYFDALTYIANLKGSYALIAYCRKQDVVGKEALDSALSLFGIDPSDTSLMTIPDELLLGVYRKECSQGSTQKHATLKNALRLLAKAKNSSTLQFYAAYEPYDNVHQAYSLLEVDESVDVDVIQTAYTIKVADSPGLKIDCDRAIYTLAVTKRSMPLFNFLVEQCPVFEEFYSADKLTYHDALSLLQVNENASDDIILEVFQRKWNHETVLSPDQFLKSSSALTKIGQVRNSLLINRYLETGTIDVRCLPARNWPTGLNNIGNTCYLNSLLQYYFCISPLRQFIVDYQKTLAEFHDSIGNLGSKRRIGGREVSESEVERSCLLYTSRCV